MDAEVLIPKPDLKVCTVVDNGIIVIGAIVRTGDGYALISPGGVYRLSGRVELADWLGQDVVVRGELDRSNCIRVYSVLEMPNDGEIAECARFVIARHGARAIHHAQERLDAARKDDDAVNLEIWRAVYRLIRDRSCPGAVEAGF